MSDFMSHRILTIQERLELARIGMARAMEARFEAGFESDGSVPAWIIAERLGVPVRYVDIDMDGMYRREPSPRILVSAQRPLARRNFTCGHELGHHVFGHGTTLEESQARASEADYNDPNEYLANSFAAHLLMPVLGIRNAFARRGITAEAATATEILTVATEYGVGYETLINQLTYAFRDITWTRHETLLAERRRLGKTLFPTAETGPVMMLDYATRLETLDIEIDHFVFAPKDIVHDDDVLSVVGSTETSRVFRAVRCGAVELSNERKSWCLTLRVAKKRFVGLARFKFLSDDEGDDDD
jgi:Zn-dependent peptidase ImmA (M78 family)